MSIQYAPLAIPGESGEAVNGISAEILLQRRHRRVETLPMLGNGKGALHTDSFTRLAGTGDGPERLPFDCFLIHLDLDWPAVDQAADLLCKSERRRARRFVFKRDRRRYIVARAALRSLLASELGLRPQDIEFDYGRYGKPRLVAELHTRDLRFNLSHCNGLAVCAMTIGREIGIDIEEIRDLSDIDEVARNCFSEIEQAAYRELDEADRLAGFFNCWTRKEAFIKAVGNGFFHPLADFDVSLAPGEPARLLRVGNEPGERCGWEMHEITPFAGVTGAIVLESPSGSEAKDIPLQTRWHLTVSDSKGKFGGVPRAHTE